LKNHVSHEESAQYEVVKEKTDSDIQGTKSTVSKDSDINIVECQAYGEVGVKYRAKAPNISGGHYEDI